nr:patatin-like protein 3 [Ipomoea batatas]GMD14476.1 patatin-like protein 3 [Ipomoea batatas]
MQRTLWMTGTCGRDAKLADEDHLIKLAHQDLRRRQWRRHEQPHCCALTHVLNNKHELPFSVGIEDLLVVSLGNGEPDSSTENLKPSSASFVNIVGDGAADMELHPYSNPRNIEEEEGEENGVVGEHDKRNAGIEECGISVIPREKACPEFKFGKIGSVRRRIGEGTRPEKNKCSPATHISANSHWRLHARNKKPKTQKVS